jgi:hypothetical protein
MSEKDIKIKDNPGFTGINYDTCHYCKYIVGSPTRDGWDFGCGREKYDGKFARLTHLDEERLEKLSKQGLRAFNSVKGCENYENSGVQMHPSVYEELVELNPNIKGTTVDENALETSYNFIEKVKGFLSEMAFYKQREEII